MDAILERLIAKINAAAIDPAPSENIYLEEVFTPETYAEILQRLPAENEYDFIEHPDAVLADGTKTRKLLDLTQDTIRLLKAEDQPFWQQMQAALISTELQHAILQKFQDRINARFGKQLPELVTVPIFYRDYPGYRISEHTDAPYKVATMQFYFPKDESQIHLGTSFHLRVNNRFELHKVNAFKPNSAYAFVRTDHSWHSVSQIAAHEDIRDSLALTIYEKGYEYKSPKGHM
jgi:hypothetical protein